MLIPLIAVLIPLIAVPCSFQVEGIMPRPIASACAPLLHADLYHTWIPGVSASEGIKDLSRFRKLVYLKVRDLPPEPMAFHGLPLTSTLAFHGLPLTFTPYLPFAVRVHPSSFSSCPSSPCERRSCSAMATSTRTIPLWSALPPAFHSPLPQLT